jgi:hypothetical protein
MYNFFQYGVANIPKEGDKQVGSQNAWVGSDNFLVIQDGN